MRRYASLLVTALITLALVAASGPARAQFGGLKDKVKKKAADKVEKKVDDTLEGKDKQSSDEADKDSGKSGKSGKAAADEPVSGESAGDGAAAPAQMSLYTKFDFVPGDRVIFFDDLAREEAGEFPSRWKLDEGVFEVAKTGDRPWILCSNRGTIRPKVAPGPLPPKYTFEMDFRSEGEQHQGHWFWIQWLGANNQVIGEFGLGENHRTFLKINDTQLSDKSFEQKLGVGVHTMRIMATRTTLKCYIDNVRVANVPAVEGFAPTALVLHLEPANEEGNPMVVGNIRYAEGGKTLKEQLDEAGRIVTHGILFASGSAAIRGESYKTLADIGRLLTENTDLRLSIEGHTDSDGADAANLDLSRKRAESVKAYLVENASVDAGRLETRGWGEGKPIDKNATPEGKANNRRVELVKL